MPFDAKVFRVMIASPGDVPAARQLVRDAIHKWNAANAIHRKAVLLPVDWENSVVPDLGGRAQAVINRQLGICDFLLCVFWTRLGTPTGDFASGTAEEIQRHVDAGHSVSLYFCSRALPQSVDVEQLQAVRAARDRYRGKGITDAFETDDELESKLGHHLNMKMNAILATDDSWLANTAPPAAVLSDEAIKLLREAAQDPTGLVLAVSSQGAKTVQTHEKLFCDGTNARESAKWVAALESLVSAQLLGQAGHSGNAFKVTHKGYQFTESL